ncbi:MAG: hypothetical protein QOK48_232 [Blastocatellia bacterium]|nr:hypothetical protein [Blastocatellia bacterium]
MITRALAIALLLSLAVSSPAQQTSEVRLDENHPTIYLAFERAGADGNLWLRLHNNTHWAINFRTELPVTTLTPLRLMDGRTVSALIDGSEVSPEYLIENLSGPGYGEYSCTMTQSWIAPGQSVIFGFPREQLKFAGRVSVSFRYEWEGNGAEPNHRVRISETDLLQLPAPAPG